MKPLPERIVRLHGPANRIAIYCGAIHIRVRRSEYQPCDVRDIRMGYGNAHVSVIIPWLAGTVQVTGVALVTWALSADLVLYPGASTGPTPPPPCLEPQARFVVRW